MISRNKILREKTFAVYGLGLTGKSVVKFFKRQKIKKYYTWDDSKFIRKNLDKKKFLKKIYKANYIVISPGINIRKCELSKTLKKNKHKLITDLDLFYMFNKGLKSIVVTGTNGKSTTCKILEHLLKINKYKVELGGNIGKPVLDLKFNKKKYYIIEASSFQLAYSKFIKPSYAFILNITSDHQDWHQNMRNYINSKFNIFSLQGKNNYAFIKDTNLIKKFKKEKYLSKLQIVNNKSYNIIKKYIQNEYLKLGVNDENMSFAYKLSKIFKIKKKLFINSFKTFKGLKHRQEIFLKKNKLTFINDSKATSFESSKHALQNNKNIYWIVGGLPKIGDRFYLQNIKKNINQVYIIGKNINFFKKQIKNQVLYKSTITIEKSLKLILKKFGKNYKKAATILLSPASASYDQFKNFGQRGDEFKRLVKLYANKYI